MKKYYLSIADVKIMLIAPQELIFYEHIKPFLLNESEGYDMKCEVIEDISDAKKIKENGIRVFKDKKCEYYEYDDNIYRFIRVYDEECYTKFHKDNLTEYEIHALRLRGGYIQLLTDLLCFDVACVHFDAFRLHSSFVKCNDRAIVFSAPCQTGKSTQASLWEKYRGAKIINGDKTFLRKMGDKWFAFGSPWAGTSGKYINEKAGNPAIVILRQAPHNRIVPISRKDAVKMILTQTQLTFWSSETLEKICNLIEDFISVNPVCLLECRPDEEATEIVDKWLLNYAE